MKRRELSIGMCCRIMA